MNATRYILHPAIFVTAVLLGLACGVMDYGECPDSRPFPVSRWTITDAEVPHLVGGIVDVGTDTVEISYTDSDGTNWLVTYRFEDPAPPST